MSSQGGPLELLIEFGNKSSSGVIVFDQISNQISFLNSSAQKTTGLSKESTPANIIELIATMPIADQRYLKTKFAELKENISGLPIEVRIHRSNIKPLDIRLSGYYLSNQTLLMVFVDDITREKEHDEYLIEFGTKKNTTLESLAHFMSGAVALMRNLSDGAGRSMREKNIAGIGTYLELIDKNATHCLEVVKNLLQEEHGKAPSVSVKATRTDIVEKIGYIVENLKMALPERTFILTGTTETVFAIVDEFKLLQIINNLASNAVKFSPADKPITFGIYETSSGIITFVSDKGIGIPTELQAHVFTRNSLAGRYGLKGEQSFGKGLSICMTLAKLLQGELWFESTPNEGSVFFLSLPSEAKQVEVA